MTNEEIVQQIQQGINVSVNHERLWLKNRKFVRWEIRKLYGLNEQDNDFEDLMQEGYIGLITAANKYNSDKGARFLTFAAYDIRRAVIRYNMNTGSGVRIPVGMRDRIRKYAKYRQQFQNDNGRYPNDEEIKEQLHLSDRQLYHLQKTIYKMNSISIDQNISENDSECSLLDMLESDQNIEELVTYSVYNEELKKALQDSLDDLDQSTRAVILNAFYQRLSLEKNAETMSCSKQNIHEMIERGFWKILHSPHRKILETFMCEGYRYNEYAHSEYAEFEDEDNEFLI